MAPIPRVMLSGQPAVTLTSPYAVAGCALTGTPNRPASPGNGLSGATRVRRRRRAGRDDDQAIGLRADRHADAAGRCADARARDLSGGPSGERTSTFPTISTAAAARRRPTATTTSAT